MSNHEGKLVGIYRLYKLGRMSTNRFDKDIKSLDRDLHPVHHSFAESSNENHQINGLWYEEDKAATKKYWNKEPYDSTKEYTPFEDVKEEKEPVGIAEIKNKLSEMTKEELIVFAEKNDYNIKKSKSAENILAELIEQIDVVE